MACTSPFDAFRMATESLSDELYRRASYRGIWLNLIPRGEYKPETGLTQSTFTIGRSEPTSDEETWAKITGSAVGCASPGVSGSSGACSVCWNDTQWGYKEQTYSPEQFGLRGPIICQDDLIFNFKASRFLEAYIMALEKRSRRSIENRYQNIYIHLVPKHSATASFPKIDGGVFTNGVAPSSPSLSGLAIPTSELTQEMLDTVAADLNELGASDPNSDGWINLGDDGPIYPLYIGQEASQDIQLNNAELRQDYRWAEPMALLKRIGATRVIRNFRHVINLFPPRYNFLAGNFVRIPTWVMASTAPHASKGNVAIINPQWKTAAYEGAIVLNPWVFHSEVVRPVNAAAGLNWTPKSYFGEWSFLTGGQEIDEAACYDPTKKLGRHFAEVKAAARPIFPEFGRFILFKRCPVTNFGTVTCAS
jgi:hypothetical protein